MGAKGELVSNQSEISNSSTLVRNYLWTPRLPKTSTLLRSKQEKWLLNPFITEQEQPNDHTIHKRFDNSFIR